MTYSVNCLITQSGWPIAAARRAVVGTLAAEASTGSAAVVGDASLVRVHATTSHPDTLLAVGMAAGTLADVTIEPRTGTVPWSHAA